MLDQSGDRTLLMGIGGAGMSIARHIVELYDCPAIAVNTNAGALARSGFRDTLLLGKGLCQGMPARLPAVAGLAAEQSRAKLESTLDGYQKLVLVAGFGGGTGTGATPVVTEMARAMEIRTVTAVVLPFECEGNRRRTASPMLAELRAIADEVRVYDNARDCRTKGYGLRPLTEFFARQAKDIAAELGDHLS